MNMKVLAGSIVALLALAASVNGAIVYSYVADPLSDTLTSGQTVPVNIYLRETLSDGSVSLLGTPVAQGGEGGLFGFGLSFVLDLPQTTAAAPATLVSVVANTAAFPDQSGFDTNLGDGLTIAWAVHADTPTYMGTEDGPNVRNVLLATITLQANGSGISTFAVSGFESNTMTRENGYAVDDGESGLFGPATTGIFRISVPVPEPGKVGVLMGFIGLALVARNRAAACPA